MLLIFRLSDDINAWQRATEKTAVHVGFVNFFCTAAVHGDTSNI